MTLARHGFLLVALALPAVAQPVPDARRPASPPAQVETIQITATRRPEATLAVPQATTVLSRESLTALSAPTVMETLRGQVGTFVQQTTPGQSVVIVRGLKGSEVLHVVDGFRLNNAIFRNAPNQYVALVDAQMLESIEVVRGPMSTLYGGDAMGGVIQMRSWEPQFEGAAWQHAARLRTSYGSANGGWLSRAEGAIGSERFALSGGLSHQDVDALRVGGGERLPLTGYSAHAADVKLRGVLREGHELTLSAQYSKQPETRRTDELTPGFGQAQPSSAVHQFEPQARALYHLRYRADAATAWFDSVEAHLGHQAIRDDRRTRDFGSRNEDRERNRVGSTGFSLQLDKAVGARNYFTYGIEYFHDEVDASRVRRDLDTGLSGVRPPRFPDGSTQEQLGVYLHGDWQASERWDVNGGLRFSHVRVETRADASEVSVRESDVSGNVGVAFALADHVRWVANAGRGFRAPNVFDLGAFGSRPGNRFNIPNADLAPETVFTFDSGFKLGGATLDGELIAFYSTYQDKISSVLTGDVTPTGQLVVQSRNAASLRLWGIEAGARWRPSERLRFSASATYSWGEERLDGAASPADRIPPLFGKIGAAWDWRPDIAVEGYVLYAAAQRRLSPRDATDPRIDPSGTDGWATLNARVAWQATEAFALSFRLENLADQRYREHGSGVDAAGIHSVVALDWRY